MQIEPALSVSAGHEDTPHLAKRYCSLIFAEFVWRRPHLLVITNNVLSCHAQHMCSHVRYQEDLLHRVILLNLRYNQSINLHFLSLGLIRGVNRQ